mgnify:CR=1 FL=1
MNNLSDFYNIVEELTDLLKTLKVIEENKLSAILEKNLIKLDACMKDEQVQVMKLRGLEKNRERIQDALGYGNLTFKQIIETAQGNEQKEAQKLFNSLQKATNDFNIINNSVKTALEVNLHSINSVLEKTDTNSLQKKRISKTNRFTSTNRFV